MRIIGCDLHTRQQTIAMFDTETKEVMETTLSHEGETVREFYSALPRPVLVGIEATGAMFWFLQLLEELGIPCRVGHPTAIRKAETRKQKHDRRDAMLPCCSACCWKTAFRRSGCLLPSSGISAICCCTGTNW